ncbi:MAG: hypothetical protein HWD92_07245 [Flavobacteriia bacterium]|nr:hypothetical protein [Flavobacteriia bacterium]
MLRFLSLFLFSLLTGSLSAQEGVNVRIEVRSPEKSPNVFITGSREDLGQWKPDEVKMRYGSNPVNSPPGSVICRGPRPYPDYYFIELTDVVEEFEFKVTLGSWETEGRIEGRSSNANFLVPADKDTTIQLRIDYWGLPSSTVRGSLDLVQLPDSLSPSGFRTVRIWNPNRHSFFGVESYPVIYAADGQNLFDTRTANFGEWKVDEFLYGFGAGPMNAIVVGIDNTPNRSQEYMDTELGEAYRAFVTETVIPYVDSVYNTIPEREFRVAAGSSAGGTVSFLHAIYDSEFFAGAMCFSPALQLQTESYDINLLPLLDDSEPFAFYMDMGGKGVDSILHPGCQLIDERLSNDQAWSRHYLGYKYIPDDNHNEAAWAERFPTAYLDMIRLLGWPDREY